MESREDDLTSAQNEVLQTYDRKIKWYMRAKDASRYSYSLVRGAAIFLGVLTPVVILTTGEKVKLLQAALAAATAVATSMMTTFRWRENWVRYALTMEHLERERTKFVNRLGAHYAPPVEVREALDNYVTRMASIIENECRDWGTLMLQDPDKKSSSGPTSEGK
jgi:hypothetical protein